MNLNCRKCGADVNQCKGYLKRVNEKGIEGIWECAPSCDTEISQDAALLMAIEDRNDKT